MNYFVTAIGTDSGKTLVSAILCEALQADYWKPVQAGSPYDADQVRGLISNNETTIHPGAYTLKTPASPHAAAAIDGVSIQLEEIDLPRTKRDLIIEGAGGCLVPLNDSSFVIDIAIRFDCQVILVSNNYLGSINHTLTTFESLQKRKLKVVGIIFNGPRNEQTERIILLHTKLPCLLKIDQETKIDKQVVTKYAAILNENWRSRA